MKAIGNFARSSSFRVGVLFTFLLTLGVLFVAYFLHLATNQVFLKESQVAVEAELDGLSRLYELHGDEAFNAALSAKKNAHQKPFLYAFQRQGMVNPRSDFIAWPKLDYDAERSPIQVDISEHGNNLLPEGHSSLMLMRATLSDSSQLIVARDVHALDRAQWVARTFGWLMIATLLLISGLSLWVGYYVVDRINRIADSIERIIRQGTLHERLPIDSSWDDLSQLSRALNRTLDELETLLLGIKSVSDNIAHDLRTPITRLRADIEHVSDTQQREELLREVDGIMAMFTGLLRIADVESNKRKEAFCKNEVKEIMTDVIELYQPLAESKQIALHHYLHSAVVDSDRDLLFQAFANVLDNAIKFTPVNGEITVTLETHHRMAHMRICDSGEGVPNEFIDKITQRFYRTEKSRQSKGHGLGLAMVNAVVKLHRGSLSFAPNPHAEATAGLCCRIEIPFEQNTKELTQSAN